LVGLITSRGKSMGEGIKIMTYEWI